MNIKGNVSAKTGAIHPFDKGIYSTVNLGLNTTKSTLEGVVWNGFDKNGNYNPEYSEQKMFYGRVNLWLANGATWTNAAWGIPGENYYGTTADKKFHGSNPTNLYGGSDAAHAGVIIQKDKNPISVENYSGNTMVIYEHDTAVPADPVLRPDPSHPWPAVHSACWRYRHCGIRPRAAEQRRRAGLILRIELS